MMREKEHRQQQIEQRREPHVETVVRARAIHSALSNQDAYEIFCLAADGINASTSILRERSFSRKRYYLRLKSLVDLELVHKDGGKYKHTPLGRMIYENQVKSLENMLEGLTITLAQN
jgi:predicted transcriptional regulator